MKLNNFGISDINKYADTQVAVPPEQQAWYADLLKFTVTSRENVLTSHWTNKVAFGPVLNCVNHPASPTAKLSAGKQAGDIHWSHTVISSQDRSALPLSCH